VLLEERGGKKEGGIAAATAIPSRPRHGKRHARTWSSTSATIGLDDGATGSVVRFLRATSFREGNCGGLRSFLGQNQCRSARTTVV
jgi:hypothetical protein